MTVYHDNVNRENLFGKILALLGAFLRLFLVAAPKDFFGWLCRRPKNVKEKCVVITGGASGLGLRMAEIFADPNGLGANVAIIDRNMEGTEKAVNRIREKGGIAQGWNCDISNADEMRRCAGEIQEHFGRADIVIANAAILYFDLTLNLKDSELRNALDVNVLGTINTIRAFLPAMEAAKQGHLVTIASIASFFGETFGMAYCPTKFAVRGAMECLRMELQDRGLHGIACTTICPFFVRTPMITSKGIRPVSRWIPFMSVDRCAQQIVDAVLREKVIAFMPPWLCMLAKLHSILSLNMQHVARDFLNFRYEAPDYEWSPEGPIQNGAPKAAENTTPNGEAAEKQMGNGAETQRNGGPSSASATSALIMQQISGARMRDRFVFAGLGWYLVIPPALCLTFLAFYNPGLLNVSWLSVLGKFVYNLGTEQPQLVLWINLLAWTVHLLEAVAAIYLTDALQLSHRSSLFWFLQTLLLGYPSLRLLLKMRQRKLP